MTDTRAWSFELIGGVTPAHGTGAPSVPPGVSVHLIGHRSHDGSQTALALQGDAVTWDDGHPAVVVLRRAGTSDDPVRHGEPLALQVRGAGYLAAARPGDGPHVVLVREPAYEWEATGATAGSSVVVGRPVGLFDLVQGDHLVPAGPGADIVPGTPTSSLAWQGADGQHRLPFPPGWRTVTNATGDIEVSGSFVPAGGVLPRAGPPAGASGGLLLLEPDDAVTLGAHLVARLPAQAADLAPGGTVTTLACHWPRELAGEALPPTAARLWVQGCLVAGPGPAVRPVHSLAWAQWLPGGAVEAVPGTPQWPQDTLRWHVVVLAPEAEGVPAGGAAGGGGAGHLDVTWLLPLPGRDGEPGSSTTFTVLAGRRPARLLSRLPGRRLDRPALPPSLVRDARTGRRALRLPVRVPRAVDAAGDGESEAVVQGVTVRVHTRD